MTTTNEELAEKAYLKGYKEGFEAATKMAWALAEELLIEVPNEGKSDVRKLIDKLKA